ncbi:MAG: phospho-N-acetylmuramoyl-pentapeptide-transferase [Clostridiales bacterium]|nr:phospho-N-acetylmuramoyl-pentapeptide-transferase [Clostridiales bacterium]
MREMLAMLLAFAVSTVVTWRLLPVLREKCRQNVYELAPGAHQKKQGTPTMGGFAIAGGGLLSALVFLATGKVDPAPALAFAALALGNLLIGFVDDMTKIRRGKNDGLTPKQKLVFQTALAFFFSLWCAMRPDVGTAIRIPFLHSELELGILYVPLMTFVIVGTTNSANLMDGLDGLLSSVALVDFGTLAFLAAFFAVPGLSTSCTAFMGGCMGFLLFNSHPAAVFMGDTGSMFIGGAVSAAALLLREPLLLVLIAFWMMMSSISDLIQFAYFRKTHGKRFFKMAPIHHHFELCGLSETKIVTMYMLTTIALCALALIGTIS